MSAQFEPARQAITRMFQDGWDGEGALPVAFDNRPFRQPATPWARFAIRFGKRVAAAIGPNFARTPGFLALQIFVPEEKGTQPAVEAADKLSGIFDHQRLGVYREDLHVGDVQFETVERQTIGRTGDGWWQENALCDLRFDEIAFVTLARMDIFLQDGSVQLQTTVYP